MRPRLGSLAVLAVAAGLAAWALIPSSGARRVSVATTVPTGDPTGAASPPGALSPIGPAPGQTGVFGPSVAVSVGNQTTGQAMKPGFLGLSLEYPTLSDYLGNDPAHLDRVFLALVRGLSPGQSPVLRIGGNSTDRTWWPIRHVHLSPGVNFALSDHWTRLARALAVSSRARLILGVNLAAGNRHVAIVEARHLLAGIGARHIDALEIGNEPDDYNATAWYWNAGQRVFARPASYTALDYLHQFTSWANGLPHVQLAGPALARTQWMPAALPAVLQDRRRVGLITFHRYPLRNCETNPRAGDYPTIPRLLGDASSAGLAARVVPYVAAAHAARRTFRIDEFNSVSCRGRWGVSNTFASALWVVDALFDMSAAGVDGVNLHMLPDSAYQAFAVSHTGSRWRATVAPLYYGMLMFARAFPPGARLARVSVPGGSLKAWATQTSTGHIRVVLINKNPSMPVSVRLAMPGARAPLSAQRLLAPSVSATSGVSFGGETFGSATGTGVLPVSRHPLRLSAVQGTYRLTLPGGSAVLLTR